jgi:hypothetical protein
MDADFSLNLTMEQIRQSLDDGDFIEDLDIVLDKAQSKVHSGEAEKATILITVTKETANA